MTIARRAPRELALAGGTAGSPRVPPSPAHSRQTAMGRARHVGRGNGNPSKSRESDP
jgi:hypothetical protein